MTGTPPHPTTLPTFPHRFRLRRGGILNVWQYDDQVFEFGDGRLLLRGRNGAGKTRALEVLLPFLLDADIRAIDTTGAQRTSFRWLMLDGSPDSNRLGYVWLELARVDEDRVEHVRTLGAAIKASRATGEAKATYFLTTRRVGEDLPLLVGRQPRPVDALRAEVGEHNCFTSPGEYRRRVMGELFGLADERRYRNVVHLLHRLRRPTIGDRIEAGQLASVLSEALPPLDEDVLESVAHNLDDLEGIRNELARLEATASAVEQFVAGYRGYVHGQIRGLARTVWQALEGWMSVRRAEQETHRAWAGQLDQVEGTAERLASLREQRGTADDTLRALRDSAAYRSLMELRDRRAAVGQARQAAESAASTATISRQAEEHAAERARGSAGQLTGEMAAARQRHGQLLGTARGIGVDDTHLGSAVTASTTMLGGGGALLRDLDGMAHEVPRPSARVLDVPATTAALQGLEAALRGAAPVVGARRRTAAELQDRVQRVERLASAAQRAEERAAGVEARLEQARRAAGTAQRAVAAESARYASSVLDWLATPLLAEIGLDNSPFEELLADALPAGGATATGPAALDPDVPERVAATARQLLTGPRRRSDEELLAAELALERARKELRDLQDEHRRVEAAREYPPPRPGWSVADRDPSAGAPFHLLVDFAPHLEAGQRAGLEAALQASGVLAGWVSRDGVLLDPGTRDLVIDPTVPHAGPTLADLLVPVPNQTGGVSAAQVRRLLACIAATPDRSAASVATTSGIWRLGVAHGAHAKDRAEYIGAATRAAARARRLAELVTRIREAEQRLRDLDARARQARERRTALAATAVPTDVELRGAWTILRIKDGDERDLVKELSDAQAALEAAQSRAATERQALLAAAASANLPPERDALLAVTHTARTLQEDLEQLVAHVRRIAGALSQHAGEQQQLAAAAARRAEAERAFEGARSAWASQAGQLAELEASVGADEQTLLARERAAEATLRAAGKALPEAERAQHRAMAGAVGAFKDWRHRELEREDAYRGLAGEAERLRLALRLPGVLLAAGLPNGEVADQLREVELPAVGDRAPTGPAGVAAELEDSALARAPLAPAPERVGLRSLHGLVKDLSGQLAPPSRDLSAAAILNRYEDLRTSLAGGYDASVDEIDGIKVFELHDDAGHHPVAAVAARLREDATRSRDTLTRREQEVFERHLLGELGDNLAKQLHGARSFEREMNRLLGSVRSSQGLGVRLEWRLRHDADADVRRTVELIPTPGQLRPLQERAALREALQRRIEAARQADPSAGYLAHLGAALDYRAWHSFTVKVVDASRPGSERTLGPRIGLSEGEKRVVSYLPLFAAAAAHFNALAEQWPATPRLILLDDAFAKVDEPTHGRLLGLLVDLDLDFIITSERMWGTFPTVPRLSIYECLREQGARGVATVHFEWDGRRKRLVSV